MLRKQVEEAIEKPLEKALYIFRRYGHPFCLIFLETSQPIERDRLGIKLRKTDKLVEVDPSHHIIFLSLIGEREGGYKAAENILTQLENKFPDIVFHIGVACKNREEQEDIVTRIFYALSNAKDHDGNFVADDYGID